MALAAIATATTIINLKNSIVMKKVFLASITCLCIGMVGLAAAEGAWREFYLTVMASGCLLLTVVTLIEFFFNPENK